MTLTAGDMAAITGMMTALTSALGVVIRYFVKSEIRNEINKLRLDLAKERAEVIAAAASAVATAATQHREGSAGK
jgi:hypothetical protein